LPSNTKHGAYGPLYNRAEIRAYGEACYIAARSGEGLLDVQAIMFMVYDYAKISDGFDAAEGPARDVQRKAMAAKAAEIRAALSAAPKETGSAA
jgi:hypothetical protein